MSKAPVRVRGMNAAASATTSDRRTDAFLTSNGTHPDDDTAFIPTFADTGNGGSRHGGGSAGSNGTRKQRFPHASMRQLMLAIVLLVVGLLIARFTYNEVAGGPAGFAGTVEPVNSVSLDFPQTGQIAQILVKPGQTVTKGQPLATLDQSGAQATLQDAEAVLAADQTVVQALQSPTLSATEKATLNLQVSAANTQLTNAQKDSSDAVTQAQALISQAQTAVNSAVTTLNTDTNEYNAQCAGTNGPLSPTPGGSKQNGNNQNGNDNGDNSGYYNNYYDDSFDTSQNSTEQSCITLEAQVTKDQAAVTSANSDLSTVKANADQLETTASNAAATANTALAQAQNEEAAQTGPATQQEISTAQATAAAAQTTVDQDKQALANLTLLSPINGTVANVGGIVGDLDGTDGVHGFSGPNALQATSGPAFSLFPPESGASSSGSGSTAQPLIWLVSPQTYAIAQVSETEISNLHPGSAAQLTVNALGKTVNATVTEINPIPVDQNGSVEYEVTLNAPTWPSGTMIGMSLNVTFP